MEINVDFTPSEVSPSLRMEYSFDHTTLFEVPYLPMEPDGVIHEGTPPATYFHFIPERLADDRIRKDRNHEGYFNVTPFGCASTEEEQARSIHVDLDMSVPIIDYDELGNRMETNRPPRWVVDVKEMGTL
ncbi:uncharacterized protein [Temnothorax nylanderi]|uniref:uncharacterized protein n=1 Tax=Temnothorax nylanderi TaxID=102681 RepID=UPI003A85C338